MSITIDDHAATTLTANLISALSQSHSLVKQLDESSRTIDQLRRQNDRLRHEVECLRSTQSKKEGQEDISEQLDQFFRKDAAKQAEIDELKKQLHIVQGQERYWRAQNRQTATPLVSSDEPDIVPSSSPPSSSLRTGFPEGPGSRATSPLADVAIQQCSSPPRKRPRIAPPDDGPLQELLNNQKPERRTHAKIEDRASRGADAIPTVAEDGEEHSRKHRGKPKEHKLSDKRDSDAIKRLGALLSTPVGENSVLSRPEQRSSKSASPAAKVIIAPSLRKSSSDLARDRRTPQERPRSRFLPPKRRPARGPEDDEPLRCRPVNRLNLSHFKLNPNVNNGYDHAYEETVRNRVERKCLAGCTRPECCGGQMEAIAATLGPNVKVSDDDLLIYLLGPGSEDKIRGLTGLARANLIHEARAKRVADAYGKMHRSLHQRAQSPTGFWNADMPGSQEERKNRDEAKRRVRVEVERRQREAHREGGKWLFVDE